MDLPNPISIDINLNQRNFEIISEKKRKYKIILQNYSESLLISASYEENSINYNFEESFELAKIKEKKFSWDLTL